MKNIGQTRRKRTEKITKTIIKQQIATTTTSVSTMTTATAMTAKATTVKKPSAASVSSLTTT